MKVSLSIHVEPLFEREQLNCVAVYEFSPSSMINPKRIPLISTFSVLNKIYVNSVELPASEMMKSEIINSEQCNSVFQLQNIEFTRNAVTNKFGNYQLLLKEPITISTLSIAFTACNSPCLTFCGDCVRRNLHDITAFIPVPTFLLAEELEVKLVSTSLHSVFTTQLCVINDFFFIIGNIACERSREISVWFNCDAKLFQPFDYLELLEEMEIKLDLNERKLDFYVDTTETEVEIYEGFAVIPMIDMENNFDEKYLEYYYTCLNALAGEIFTFPTRNITEKRAMLVLHELAKLIINREMLTEEENEWNLYNTKLNWGVYCNAQLPELWGPNYEEQKTITDEYIDYTLKMGYMNADVRVSGVKWSSISSFGDSFETLEPPSASADIEKFIQSNVDLDVETTEETVPEKTEGLNLLLHDFSYPRADSCRQRSYLELRAKIIAFTLFNNTEDCDTLLSSFLSAGRFDLSVFFRIIGDFECSSALSTQAVGTGPDSSISEYHKFEETCESNTATSSQSRELYRVVFELGYTNSAPRYFLFDRTDSQTDKSKFELGIENNSACSSFDGFIFNKLETYDGSVVCDIKLQRKRFERGVTEKLCNLIVEREGSGTQSSEWKETMGVIDPLGALPFLLTSRYMAMLADERPVCCQIYSRESKIQQNDGGTPYLSVIETVVSFSKFYYEQLLPKTLEFTALHDPRLREIALCGIFRAYSQYNTEDYSFAGKNLENFLQDEFRLLYIEKNVQERKVNIAPDCAFCMEVLFDPGHFRKTWEESPSTLPSDYVISLCAVLLGYIRINSFEPLFDFVEFDYYEESHNNVITICVLQALAWQLQEAKERHSVEVEERIINLFKELYFDSGNSVTVRRSILRLIAFLFCTAERDIICNILKAFDFEEVESKCGCVFCSAKETVSITHLAEFFRRCDGDDLGEIPIWCIQMLFTQHCPSYDANSYFTSCIDPEFLLQLARPGECYLKKCTDQFGLMAPNPALDWMIKDQYRHFMLTDHPKTLNILYDCQFCYLGGACSCSRSSLPREKVQILSEALPTEMLGRESKILQAVLKAPLHDHVNACYRKASAYTTNEQLASDISEIQPPQIAPLPEIPADQNSIWKQDYENRLKAYCSYACIDGQECVSKLFEEIRVSECVQTRKEYLQAISNACETSFITEEQFWGDFDEYITTIEHISQISISRTLAAIRQVEDEAAAIQNDKNANCRVYEEELNMWIYIEQLRQIDEWLKSRTIEWPKCSVRYGCLDVI